MISGEALQHLQDQIEEWQGKTFAGQTLQGKLAHLVDEARELRADPDDVGEWADVLILLLGSAAMHGMSVADLVMAARVKFALARERKWGPANEQGFYHHVP